MIVKKLPLPYHFVYLPMKRRGMEMDQDPAPPFHLSSRDLAFSIFKYVPANCTASLKQKYGYH